MSNATIKIMTAHDTQSFFKPKVFSSQTSRLVSTTYNLAHVLLNRSESDHLFIPIRSLQYLALIEKDAFWFIDSMAYAVQDDEGGRLIKISWHPLIPVSQREGLTQHMDCEVNFYGEDMSLMQTRLNNEFYQAMLQIDQRHRDTISSTGSIKILSLK